MITTTEVHIVCKENLGCCVSKRWHPSLYLCCFRFENKDIENCANDEQKQIHQLPNSRRISRSQWMHDGVENKQKHISHCHKLQIQRKDAALHKAKLLPWNTFGKDHSRYKCHPDCRSISGGKGDKVQEACEV